MIHKCLLVFAVFAVVVGCTHANHLRAVEGPQHQKYPEQICKTCLMLYDVYDSAMRGYNATTQELFKVGLTMCNGFIGDYKKYQKECRNIVMDTNQMIKYMEQDLSAHPTCQKLGYCSGCRQCPGMAECLICDGREFYDTVVDNPIVEGFGSTIEKITENVGEFLKNNTIFLN